MNMHREGHERGLTRAANGPRKLSKQVNSFGLSKEEKKKLV